MNSLQAPYIFAAQEKFTLNQNPFLDTYTELTWAVGCAAVEYTYFWMIFATYIPLWNWLFIADTNLSQINSRCI
jgi:hypothetical protein